MYNLDPTNTQLFFLNVNFFKNKKIVSEKRENFKLKIKFKIWDKLNFYWVYIVAGLHLN